MVRRCSCSSRQKCALSVNTSVFWSNSVVRRAPGPNPPRFLPLRRCSSSEARAQGPRAPRPHAHFRILQHASARFSTIQHTSAPALDILSTSVQATHCQTTDNMSDCQLFLHDGEDHFPAERQEHDLRAMEGVDSRSRWLIVALNHHFCILEHVYSVLGPLIS